MSPSNLPGDRGKLGVRGYLVESEFILLPVQEILWSCALILLLREKQQYVFTASEDDTTRAWRVFRNTLRS
ncbi:hypothetical protein U27_06738 [Candidatus Vecturithrix granuli]|uniref:Uncharacterized protein n=1 Tax=Vecturithrix granuli TaxID=1499967 RepID=A0A081C598_VECG1|nr:hypothetical protein U27_06738 [Candidatus Vecturithrix granuli]